MAVIAVQDCVKQTSTKETLSCQIQIFFLDLSIQICVVVPMLFPVVGHEHKRCIARKTGERVKEEMSYIILSVMTKAAVSKEPGVYGMELSGDMLEH